MNKAANALQETEEQKSSPWVSEMRKWQAIR